MSEWARRDAPDTRPGWSDGPVLRQCNDHGSNLFDEFQELTNVHHSSRLGKVTSGSKTIIEVTCAGSLSGLSKTGGLRVPIDS